MLILASTTDKLRLTTSSVAPIDVLASWVDNLSASNAITPGVTGTAISSATTTDIVAAPGLSTTYRNVKTLNIRNKDAAVANTVTVIQNVTGTGYELLKVTLLAGQELTYVEGTGWVLIDTNGSPVAASAVPMTRVVLTAGSAATYTTPARCRAIDVIAIGGGGAGGGGATAASSGAMGGGGGSGGLTEKLIASPAATYTYTIGAGGTGVSAAAGNNGADTTFSTLTAKGGSGGGAMAAAATAAYAAGGAGGVAGSGGDINSPGAPGAPGMRATAALGASGNGGNSAYGAGALGIFNAQATGNAAVANTGGGGSGGSTISAGAATLGGAGGSGILLITEYY